MLLCAYCLGAAGEANELVLDDTFHLACPVCGLIDDRATAAFNAHDADSLEGHAGRKMVNLLIDIYLTDPVARIVSVPSPQHRACVLAWYDRMRLANQAQGGGKRKTIIGIDGSQRLHAHIIVAIRFAVQEANLEEVERRLWGVKVDKQWEGTGVAVPDATIAPPGLKTVVEQLNQLPTTHTGYFNESVMLAGVNKRFTALLRFNAGTLEQVLAHLIVIQQRIERLISIHDWRERIRQLCHPRLRTASAHKTRDVADEDDYIADSASWAFFAAVDWPAILPAALGLYRAQETVSLWGKRPYPGTAVALLYHAAQAVAGREWPDVLYWEDELLAPYGRDHKAAMFRRAELKDLLVCWSTSFVDAGLEMPVVPRPKRGYIGTGLSGYASDHRRALPELVMAVAAAPTVARYWQRIMRARLATRDAALPLDHEYAIAAQAFARTYIARTGHVREGKKRARAKRYTSASATETNASETEASASATETSMSVRSTTLDPSVAWSEASTSGAPTPMSEHPPTLRGVSPMSPPLLATAPMTPSSTASVLPSPSSGGPTSRPVVPVAPACVPHVAYAPPPTPQSRQATPNLTVASSAAMSRPTPAASATSSHSRARDELLRKMGVDPSSVPSRPTPPSAPPIVLAAPPKKPRPASASIEAMLAAQSDSSEEDAGVDSDDEDGPNAPPASARRGETLFGAVKPGAVYGFSIGPNGFTVEDAPRAGQHATVPAAARYQHQHAPVGWTGGSATADSRGATSAANSHPAASRATSRLKRFRAILPAPPQAPVTAAKVSPANTAARASPAPPPGPTSRATSRAKSQPAKKKAKRAATSDASTGAATPATEPDTDASTRAPTPVEASTRDTTPALSLVASTLRSVSPSLLGPPPPPPDLDACHEAVLIRERDQYLRYEAAAERSAARRAPAEVETAMQRWVDAKVAAGEMPHNAIDDKAYLASFGIHGDPRSTDLGPWLRSCPWRPIEALLRAGLAPRQVPAHHLVHSTLALAIHTGCASAALLDVDPADQTAAEREAECAALFASERGLDAAYLMSAAEADARERLYLASGTWDFPRGIDEGRAGRKEPGATRRKGRKGKANVQSRINEDVLRSLVAPEDSSGGNDDDDDEAMRDFVTETLLDVAGLGRGANGSGVDEGEREADDEDEEAAEDGLEDEDDDDDEDENDNMSIHDTNHDTDEF
ncbi:hypothetical protein Q5752_001316 [Cryptotrichosporon argae]